MFAKIISVANELDDGMTTHDERAHELSAELRIAVGRLSRRIRAEKASDELGDGQFSVLALLFREGPLTVGALAERERVTPPSMNRRVNYLLELGFVSKEGMPEDGRKVLVRATDEGARFVTETRRRREEWLFQRVNGLPAEHQDLLLRAAALMREVADAE